jgi:Uma2 family endonuclease
MNIVSPRTNDYYSRDAFRRWCDAQPSGRYERVDGRIVAMAPERGAHLRVKGSVYLALVRAVSRAGLSCQALPDGATVETGDSDYQPDALVNCGEPMADDAVAAPNPVIVVEVLSPGTTATDTGAKLADYFRVPSVAHYLIVHPTRRSVTHHRRTGDGIETRIVVNGPIAMEPPGVVVTVEEIYGEMPAIYP